MKTARVGLFDWFNVHDRRRVEAAIETLAGVRRIREGEWAWYESSATTERWVANVFFDEDSLVLETQREADADRCGSRLQRAAGDALEFLIGEARHVMVGNDASGPPDFELSDETS